MVRDAGGSGVGTGLVLKGRVASTKVSVSRFVGYGGWGGHPSGHYSLEPAIRFCLGRGMLMKILPPSALAWAGSRILKRKTRLMQSLERE